jgi:hypothetical protein
MSVGVTPTRSFTRLHGVLAKVAVVELRPTDGASRRAAGAVHHRPLVYALSNYRP